MAILVVAANASAQGRPLAETSPFWRRARAPGYERAEALKQRGAVLLVDASREYNRPYVRAALVEGAIARFERALAHMPGDPEALLMLGRALLTYERPDGQGGVEQRQEDAHVVFLRLRAEHPEFRRGDVEFSLGLVYTHLQEYEEAIAAYQTALRYELRPELASTTCSNMAEVQMMSGQLEAAVESYRRALRFAAARSGDTRTAALAQWGLALALDRNGEQQEALAAARLALSLGDGEMSVLRSDGVFFDPPSEIHAYELLGHLSLAESEPEFAEEHLGHALRSARAYLGLSLSGDPWRRLIEAHRDRILRQLGRDSAS